MKGTSAFVALLLAVGLLAVGFAAVPAPASAEGTEEVMKVLWVDGAAFEDIQGADKTGDYGRLSVGDEGMIVSTFTSHANATPDGTSQLINRNDVDLQIAISFNNDIASVTRDSDDSWIVEAHSPGRVGIFVLVEDGDDEYFGYTNVHVVDEPLDETATEGSPEERFFSDMDVAPAIIVITMIVIALALPVLFKGFMSLVLAMFFAVFAALWFVGLVPVMIVVAGWIISMMASLIEGVFG